MMFRSISRSSAPISPGIAFMTSSIDVSGTPADTSIGFWMTNSCDKFRLKNSGSQGHASGSFVVDSGCTNGVIEDCYSGIGDGVWSDADHTTTFSDFKYRETIFKDITFTAAGGVGGTGTNYNLFKVTGTVKIKNIWGTVSTVIPNTSSNVNLELYSTNGSVNITNSVGAPDIDSFAVGAVLVREGPATDALVDRNPDGTPAVAENTDKDPNTPLICAKDDSADTYIQLVLDAALASGAMRWRVEWEQISENGFLEPA